MVLVGPSGCGKTTALRMVAGLEDVSEGALRIGERVVNHVPSRDRDIAMVFQSYALYPHLTVYENIAFGLRLKKLPKGEIDKRVQMAARTLGLGDLLKRKPRNLSGGQRQRVAMGRAIVREPAAFLMDEPLSNLDAKLRVQMRAEISRLQHDLGVTTIYVTHDQIEAMTMGDRVAVMRKGELQQVAEPQTLYDRPVNLFVGGFIGSPAMNMVDATVARRNGGLSVDIGGQTLGLGGVPADGQAALGAYEGKPVILGIRPEHLEEASLAHDPAPDRRLRGQVELREALGSELIVHFSVEGAHAAETEEMQELAIDIGAPDESVIQSPHAVFVGRFGARAHADEGAPVDVAVDTTALHFFDPETGLGIYARDERSTIVTSRWTRRAAMLVVPIAVLAVSATGSGATKATQHAAAGPSGTITFDGVWTGAEAKAFGAVISAFEKQNPGVKVNYKPVGDNLPTVLSTAVAGGNPPDMADIAQPGLVKQFADQGAAQADHVRTAGARGELRPVLARPRHLRRQALRARLQGEQQVDRLVQHRRRSRPRASPRRPRGSRSCKNANTLLASGTPAYSIGGADGWTLTDLFENIYLRQAGAAKYNAALGAQAEVDRSVRHRGAEDDGPGARQLGQPRRRHVGGGADGLPDLGQQRLPERRRRRDRDRGRLRPRRRDREGASPESTTASSPSRRSTARSPRSRSAATRSSPSRTRRRSRRS